MIDDEAAAIGVGDERDVCRGGGLLAGALATGLRDVEVKNEVVGEAGGEDERGTFYGKDDFGFKQAGDGFGVSRAERRRDGLLDGGQTDDDDGLGIAKGGSGVEAEVEALLLGEGDGWDVLVLSGVEAAEDAEEIDDGADVGAVGASASDAGVAGCSDEVGVGAGGEDGDDGLGVPVVEQGLVAGLDEAVVLQVHGTLEAVLVGLEVEGAGEKVGVVEEGLGIGGGGLANGGDVFLDASLLEACLEQVLGGADEGAGAAADCFFKGGEVAAGFGSEEEEGLLGLVGNGDGDSLVGFVIPGLDLGEPLVGRWVGAAAKERDDEQKVDGLSGRQVKMEPELVAGLEIGDVSDGKGLAVAGDAGVDLGAGQIEARAVGGRREGKKSKKKRGQGTAKPEAEGKLLHHIILDGAGVNPGARAPFSCESVAGNIQG